MEQSKSNVLSYRIGMWFQLVGGVIMICIFGLGLLGFALDPSLDQIAALLVSAAFVGLGVWLVVLGRRRSRVVGAYWQYKVVLEDVSAFSISQLAQIFNSPEQQVYCDLRQMAKRNFFPGSYIDEQKRSIIFPGNRKAAQPPAREMLTVICEHCRGKNTVQLGHTTACEYCGNKVYGVYSQENELAH